MSAIAIRASAMLNALAVPEERPRRVGKLAAYDGLMFEATGFDQPIGAGARIVAGDGRAARAEVIGFRADRTLLMALDPDAPYASGARVEPDIGGSLADVGAALLRRVIEALSVPLDRPRPIAPADPLPLLAPPRISLH